MISTNPDKQFEDLKKKVVSRAKDMLTVDYKDYKVRADKVWIDDNLDVQDIKSQKDAKDKNKTWAIPVYASVKITDNNNIPIASTKKIKIFDLPKMTSRLGFIVEGTEYQVSNQFRLKPGVYTRELQTGELASQVNLAKGKNFTVKLNPKTKIYRAEFGGVGGAKANLYSLLKILGTPEQDIKNVFGESLYLENIKKANVGADAKKIYKAVFYEDAPEENEAVAALQEYFKDTQLNEAVTKVTLGRAHKSVTSALLLDTAKKLLAVNKGEEAPDDREDIQFKNLFTVEDIVDDRLRAHTKKIQGNIKRRLSLKDITEVRKVIQPEKFGRVIKSLFNSSDLSMTPEQINPVHMINTFTKTTVLGEGGIGTRHAVVNEQRDIDPSHLGFLDPAHSPEGQDIGTTLHLSVGADKTSKGLVTQVYNPKTNKLQFITPAESNLARVAFPEQHTGDKYKPSKKKIDVMYKGELETVTPGKVDYIIPSSTNLFDIATNMIPFLNSDQGARAQMGAKMIEQAMSLTEREVPFVQAQARRDSKISFENIVGRTTAVSSPAAGVVTKITDDNITIKDTSGNNHQVPLYNNFGLNTNSFLNNEPIVAVGANVKKGQTLADSNFTREGTLALGKNLLVGYIPYKGYNFEDGIVISETAAKKTTSSSMEKYDIPISTTTRFNLKKFLFQYPQMLTSAQTSNLDEEGIIKTGSIINPGDVIFAYLQKQELSIEDELLGKISKALKKPFKSKVTMYTLSDPGEVVEVIRNPKNISVRIRVDKLTRIGDKFAGRHGNKGVVTLIVPDGEMPRTKDGQVLDMLLNPHGIISRGNAGQLLETAAGKIAEKTGKPYIIKNFSPEDQLTKIKKELADNGLKDTEILIDPTTERELGKVAVGRQYIMKLNFPVEKKFSARSVGTYSSDLVPTRGGGEGGQALDPLTIFSLLAHGAKHNLRDATIKGQKNDEYWRALQLKEPLPAPRPSFAFEKQISLMKVLGANVEKKGSKMRLVPLTEGEIKQMSSGEVTSGKLFLAKNLKPEKNGLFDPIKTGGLRGDRWTHIKLAEEMPNPIFEDAIKSIANVTQVEFDKFMDGDLYVDKSGKINSEGIGVTGAKALKKLLSAVDLQKLYKESLAEATGATNDRLNKLNKRIRFLKNLLDQNLDTKIYFTKLLPVLPPKYRPIYPSEDGSGTLAMTPINYLYKDTIDVNEQLKNLSFLPDEEKKSLRKDLYSAVKAVVGLGNPLTNPDYSGVVDIIKGKGQPKSGFFQSRLVSKRQDLTGRSTITTDQSMDIDEVGVPEDMLYKIFEPFVVQELKSFGVAPLSAKTLIEDRDPRAAQALDTVLKKRTVLLNRAPSLHKHSIMAMKPLKVSGKSIKLHPLTFKGFNSDLDGDSCNSFVYIDLRQSSLSKEGVHRIHISEMPHLSETKRITESGNEEYDVPEGVFMFSHAEGDKQITLRPVTKWSVHKNLETVEIRTRKNHSVEVSIDHSLYCINTDTLECEKTKPLGSEKKKTPCPAILELPKSEYSNSIDMSRYEESKWSTHDTLALDEYTGYLLGAICGDGYSSWSNALKNPSNYSARNILTLSSVDEGIKSKYIDCLIKVGHCGAVTQIDNPHTFKGFECFSQKVVIRNSRLSQLCADLLGHGAENKHLPPFFLGAPEDFRWGMLSGLIATGGCVTKSKAKSKKAHTYAISYTTISEHLADDVRMLCTSLRLRSSKSKYTNNEGTEYWGVNIFTIDVCAHTDKLITHHTKKDAILKEISIHNWGSSAVEQHDIVPVPLGLLREMRKLVGAPRDASKEHKCFYQQLSKENDHITRATAFKCVDYLGETAIKELYLGEKWLAIVANRDIYWDIIESVTPLSGSRTMWDVTVPEAFTFMTAEQVVIYDTMSVHVPISQNALNESLKMLPSQNLFNSSGEFMAAPSQEAQIGLYMLTEEGKKTKKTYVNIQQAIKSYKNGELEATDIITVGSKKTTVGKILVNNLLPKNARDASIILDKDTTKNLLSEIAKNNPGITPAILGGFKDLGNSTAYERGFTTTLNDLEFDRKGVRELYSEAQVEADRIIATVKDKRKKNDKLVQLFSTVDQKVTTKLKRELGNTRNSFYDMVVSGAKGNWGQVKQMLAAPGLVQSIKGNVLTKPIVTPYASGLDSAEYWTSLYGARKGIIERAKQTAEPGELSKSLLHSTMDNVITMEDCGTRRGVKYPVSDPEIEDRYLAVPAAGMGYNDLITGEARQKLLRKRVKTVTVRSPLTCEAPTGTCSRCFGLDEMGNPVAVGVNIGVISGQSITEPTSQMTMNAFHSGGLATSRLDQMDPFTKVRQMLEFPKTFVNAATLSRLDGTVDKIENAEAGGSNITISGEKHFVPQKLNVLVKKGQKVIPGQALSDGIRNPREVLELEGLPQARKYIADELYQTYKNMGKDIRKKHFEVVARSISNSTIIKDPKGSFDFVPGDMASYNLVVAKNRKNANIVETSKAVGLYPIEPIIGIGAPFAPLSASDVSELKRRGIKEVEVSKSPIIHQPVLRGVNMIPREKRDWLSQLAFRNLKDTLVKGVSQGWESDLYGSSPIPGIAYGVGFPNK